MINSIKDVKLSISLGLMLKKATDRGINNITSVTSGLYQNTVEQCENKNIKIKIFIGMIIIQLYETTKINKNGSLVYISGIRCSRICII